MILASNLNKPTELASTLEGEQEAQTFDPIPESDDPADYLIRANQGHSIKVDTEGLLTPITEEAGNVPSTVVHGTDEAAWRLILKSGGLRKMTRNHMHFASGLPAGFKTLNSKDLSATPEEKEAPPVISGMRKSSTVLIYIDISAAMAAGIKFYLSDNGVVLSEGNEKGVLASEFFKRVESRKRDGVVLMENGVVPEGTEVNVEEWEKEVGGGKRGGKAGRSRGGGARGGNRGGGGRGKERANDDSQDLLAGV
jgi:2'-phosphotransferase